MCGRIVITGAGGQLGSCLAARAPATGRPVLALTSAQWDITDPAAAERAAGTLRAEDVLVNCAAYTDVDGAESNPDAAQAVNATGPRYLAAVCGHVGARLIHISTDYVFSGDFGPAAPRPYEIDDVPAPRNVYGRSKLAGERAVHEVLPSATVVRTAWVYTGGLDGTDFVATMRRLAAGERTVEVVDDQVGSPTYVGDLADAVLAIIDLPVRAPLLHAANRGAVSRYEQARAVFAAVGADPQRVRPITSTAHPRPAARPHYSALASAGSARAGLIPLRDWRAALAEALQAPGSGRR